MKRAPRPSLALLAALVLIGAGIVYLARERESEAPAERADVLQAIPEGALAAVVVDLAALRASPLGASLLGEGRRAAGLGEIAALCGADPLETVEQVALALSPEGVDAGFGVFATGDLAVERQLACAERLLLERGGKPVRVQEDGFAILRDGAAPSAELALRDGGPLVLSERAYLREALATARGEHASLAADAAHAALRARIGPGAIVATAVLSPTQRQSLRDALRRRSDLEALSAAALRIELTAEVELHALLSCDRPAACPALARELEATLRDVAAAPLARLLQAAPLLERLRVRAEADAVRLDGSFPLEELLTLQRRLEVLASLGAELEAPAPATAPDAGH